MRSSVKCSMSSSLREQLARLVERPAEQRQEIEHRVRQIAVVAELQNGCRSVPLAQFRAVGPKDDRQVNEVRHVVPQRLVEHLVARRARQPLLRSHHVRYLHRMVVHYVRQVIRREAVRLQQNEIVEQRYVERNRPAHEIIDGAGAFEGRLEAHHGVEILSLGLLRLDRIATAAVVAGAVAFRLLLAPHVVDALLGAVAEVRLTFGDEALGVLLIERKPLRLDVRAVSAVLPRPLVPIEAEPRERVEDRIHRPRHEARLIRVLDAHDERPAGVAGVQPVEQS